MNLSPTLVLKHFAALVAIFFLVFLPLEAQVAPSASEAPAATPAPAQAEATPAATASPLPTATATPASTAAPNVEQPTSQPAEELSPVAPEPVGPTGTAPAPPYVEPPVLPGLELPPIPPPPYQLPPSVTGLEPQAPPQIDPEQVQMKVSRFNVKYATLKPPLNPKLPPVGDLLQTTVELGKTPEALVGPGVAPQKVTLRLADHKRAETFSGGALQAVCAALSKRMNAKGLYSVFAVIDPKDIGPSLEDLRGGRTNLTILVYTFEVKQIRTVNKSPRVRAGEPVIDNPRYAKIARHSPISTSPVGRKGNLLQKEPLEEYLSRLNRFPGRRVDAAVSSTGEPGELVLDYLVREDKPLFAYFQLSNTGTDTTNDWQERFGLEYRQLAHLDDILSLEYVTSGFSASNAVLGSYQFTPLFPDLLKVKVFGSYGEFTAADVGFDLLNFSGTLWNAGALVTWSPFRWQGFAFDFFGGLTWQNVSVNNEVFGVQGQTDFFLPVIGLTIGKLSDRYALTGTVQVETNIPGLAGTDANELEKLGRFQTNRDFSILQWDWRASAFLEPLLSPGKWRDADAATLASLSHELALTFRGQYTFGDRRLVPQYEEVVGGFNSVRGYPESIAAADTVLIANAEYRYHLLHRFISEAKKKQIEAPPGSKFSLRPPTLLGRPWDLSLHTFLDFGQTYNNRILASTEVNRTLVGTGIGVELNILRETKPDVTGLRSILRDMTLSVRLDWGFALDPIHTLTTNRVDRGDSRLHFAGTITF